VSTAVCAGNKRWFQLKGSWLTYFSDETRFKQQGKPSGSLGVNNAALLPYPPHVHGECIFAGQLCHGARLTALNRDRRGGLFLWHTAQGHSSVVRAACRHGVGARVLAGIFCRSWRHSRQGADCAPWRCTTLSNSSSALVQAESEHKVTVLREGWVDKVESNFLGKKKKSFFVQLTPKALMWSHYEGVLLLLSLVDECSNSANPCRTLSQPERLVSPLTAR
jgi:hypothetical protein